MQLFIAESVVSDKCYLNHRCDMVTLCSV